MKTENYRPELGHRLDQKITDRRAGTDWISQDKQAGKSKGYRAGDKTMEGAGQEISKRKSGK